MGEGNSFHSFVCVGGVCVCVCVCVCGWDVYMNAFMGKSMYNSSYSICRSSYIMEYRDAVSAERPRKQ